jgi:type IX secretion system PorP/SprF family membrane protein
MKKIFTIIFLAGSLVARAQDPEFSQYYAAPLYLNPAFCGTSVDHRFNINYRNQWPNITNAFHTYAASYDYNLDQLNSGLGVLLMVDEAGSANLKSTQVNFQYSYKVHLSEKWILSSGLNFGLGFRSLDYNKLIFYDELDFLQSGGAPPDKRSDTDRVSYFDFGGGMLAYSRKFWIGFSVAHLNRPNRSLVNEEAEIPIKTSIHGGVRIPLYHGLFKKDRVAAIAPSFVYKQQGAFDQLDIGTDPPECK